MNSSTLNFDVDRYLNRFIPRSRLHLLPKSISWFLGYRGKPRPGVGNLLVWWWALIGSFCGILAIEAVFQTKLLQSEGAPIIIASLGAAAVLEFNTIESPLAQPRNAILGQVFSALIGVSITRLFQLNSNFEELRWVAGALSVGLASAVMGLTGTIHPPAGATALLAATSKEITEIGWFLVPLITLGNVLMLAVACITNNIQRQFPIYWWTKADLRRSSTKTNDIETQKATMTQEVALEDQAAISQSNWQHVGSEDANIVIDNDRIVVPSWLGLSPQEISVLEALRMRMQEGLKKSSTRSSGKTEVSNS